MAKDREAVLQQLIPGTEAYYYYHCLNELNRNNLDEVEKLLAAWIKRTGNNGLSREIEYRHALMLYDRNPEESLAFLKRTLQLRFDHQQQALNTAPDLPTELEETLYSRDTFQAAALNRSRNTDAFEDSALAWLAETDLDPGRRRHLLSRLNLPNVKGLVELVVADLKHSGSQGFGSLKIHNNLTLDQLEACREAYPPLGNQPNFVLAYIGKLRPSNDTDWRHSDDEYSAYLDRLWDAVESLPPAFNSLKAHVLFHQLVREREQEQYDEEKFLTYLRLPRQMPYVNRRYLSEGNARRYLANLSQDFQNATALPTIGNDEQLVRSFLQHFFVEANDYQKYARFVNENYLKRQFAEAKILNGVGDQEEWYSLLSPSEYQALKERVDLKFAYANDDFFAAKDPVALDLWIKNVDKLIVKVFEINTRNYYQDQLSEINTNINLDGLVANQEFDFNYEEGPLRQKRRRFEFPELNRPGVFVIDFIGNGQSSRVVIRKGQLRHTVQNTINGHQFTIRTELNEPVKDATIWLGGREFKAEEDGRILIPYTSSPRRQAIVIQQGARATLDYFQHEAENYRLDAGIYVDRESLIADNTARALIRVQLMLNGKTVPLELLENVTLRLTSVDLDQVATSKTVENFELVANEEATYEFKVPSRLSQLTISIQGTLKRLTDQKEITLASSNDFQVNQVDRTLQTDDFHLGVGGEEFYLAFLGKTGEPRADQAVSVTFKHRDFRFELTKSLKTDIRGIISLGSLQDIASLKVRSSNGTEASFSLPAEGDSYPSELHAVANSSIVIPFHDESKAPQPSEVNLFELRGESYAASHFEKLRFEDGAIQIDGLAAGDYLLSLAKKQQAIRIRVSQGKADAGFVLGENRQLELNGRAPFYISTIEETEGLVRIQTQNRNSKSRIHVLASRFMPAFSAFGELGTLPVDGPLAIQSPRAKSLYVAGRKIGDEYQYILDRRYAQIYPGNMLERPSLILNPWEVRSTQTERKDAANGDDFDESPAAPNSRAARVRAKRNNEGNANSRSSLEFLAEPSSLTLNLLPDENGVVEISTDELEGYGLVRIVAIGEENAQSRYLTLDSPSIKRRDLRLAEGLNPELHYTQQKIVEVIAAEETLQIGDFVNSKFETYRSIKDVYRLFMSLTNDNKLKEFSFILDWQEKSLEEKRALYSEFACHELNFYLSKKDPDFFYDVVQPYLANKFQKTFVDEYLLKRDLSAYESAWLFRQLNVAEQIMLIDRMQQDRAWGIQHIQNVYDLSPTRREAFNQLFATAVKGNALDTEDSYGLVDAVARFEAPSFGTDDKRISGVAGRPGGGMGGGGGGLGGEDFYSGNETESRGRRASPAESLSRLGREALMEKEEVQDGLQELSRGLSRRNVALKQFYQQVDKTKEWAENNYYKIPLNQVTTNLVAVDRFWLDYVKRQPNQPFLSSYFPEATSSFAEMMLALSVIDLPAESPDLDVTYEDRSMTAKTQAPMIAFHEQLQAIAWTGDATPVLVSQNFFRHGDRFVTVGSEKVDKFVSDEFLSQTAYGCQVVVTNPTSTKQKIDVLVQIPEGALALNGEKMTKTVSVDLEPYNTQSIEYAFYFPIAGSFQHFPVHVSKDEKLVAFAEPLDFKVVDQLSKLDQDSWAYVSQFGTDEQVLEFIKSNNMLQHDLSKIAFRMKEQPFFDTTIELLSQLKLYNSTLWSYGLLHNDVSTIREYLQFSNTITNQVGASIDSTLLTLDPVVRRTYEHLEYHPLINARSHQLGNDRTILNDRFLAQYRSLMSILKYQANLNPDALMTVTYYMLLQDRIEEAIELFGRINPDQLDSRMQYDYFDAYLAMYQEEPERAKQISSRYLDFAVDRWREAFENVVAQVNELEGASVSIVEDGNRDQTLDAAAQSMPNFDIEVNSKTVTVDYKNIQSIQVNYYVMDIELLFSRNPFVQQQTGQFAYIRPNHATKIELSEENSKHDFEVPEHLQSSNMLIEVVAGGIKKSQAYYSNAINVQMVESFGLLNVGLQSTGRPLPKTYVKVYSRQKNGTVAFYKDGYTDLRGRFDYSSLSTNDLDNVERFAILVFHEEHGATVREAAPPQR